MPLAIGKFPNPIELQRIDTLGKYQSLYEGDQRKVLGLHSVITKQYAQEKDIVYLNNPIPSRVADFYGDFVAGDPDKMVIKAGDDIPAHEDFVEQVVFENDLKERINDYGVSQSEFGFTVLLGWYDDEKIYHIDQVPDDQYFPQADGSVIIATYKIDPASPDMTKPNLLLYTKRYYLKDDDCIIERAAWRVDDRCIIKDQYPLTDMAKLLGYDTLEAESKLEGLKDVPIRQIDNTQRNKYGFGKSDIADSIAQLAEINERLTQASTVFLKNLDSKMQLPASMFDEEGKVKVFDAVMVADKDDVEAKYITNDNPLLSESREYVMIQAKMVSFSTAVPMFELLKSSMPERVEALTIQMFAAIRRANRKRARIKRALNDMFRLGFKMAGIDDWEGDIDIVFSDVLPIDNLLQAEAEATKIRAGISSRRGAIMRIEGVTPDEADEELKQIAIEDKMIGVFGGTPPQLGGGGGGADGGGDGGGAAA